MTERFDKEQVYDEQISPLIKQIIEICEKNHIPYAGTFGLRDEGDNGFLMCSTVVDHDTDEQIPESPEIEEIKNIIDPPKLFNLSIIINDDINDDMEKYL
jgi:hypothetical protein